MHQRGNVGREVLRDCWWDSGDVDGAHIIRADCAEVLEVLEDHPPTWDAAALTGGQITDLLAAHHPGAAEAAQAWIAAGPHVSYCHGGLAIHTPRPPPGRSPEAATLSAPVASSLPVAPASWAHVAPTVRAPCR